MVTIGLADLKSRLGRCIALVKKGEDVLITERGEPIARIVQEEQAPDDWREGLAPLVAEGWVHLPEKERRRSLGKPIRATGKPLSEIVIEDRR